MTASTANPLPEQNRTEANLGILGDLIGFRMRRIHTHMTRHFTARLGDNALRPGGFSALALISANPGLSQQMLSEALGQDKATVVALLDELETRGWAERRRGSRDRRRHDLHITTDGEAALAQMAAEAAVNEQAVVNALSPDDFATLLRLLDELYQDSFRPHD